MNRPLLAAVAGLAVLGLAAAGAYLLASPDGEEELALQAQETPTPSATPEASASPTASAPAPTLELLATPTLPPGLPPPPEGFVIHFQAASERYPSFSFAYPAGWFIRSSGPPPPGSEGFTVQVYSWDYLNPPRVHYFPPDSIKVELLVDPLSFAMQCPRPDAAATTLGEVVAGQTITTYEGREDGLVKVIYIQAAHKGYCYTLAGYFSKGFDEAVFTKIVQTFTFGLQPSIS